MNFKRFMLAVKQVLVDMAIECELPSDMNQLDIQDVFNRAFGQEKLIIHIVSVSMEEGNFCYAGITKEDAYAKLAKYCRDSWNECINQEPLTGDESDEDVIDMYFDNDHGNTKEFLEFDGAVEL